jgi:hypothetical protein
VTTNRRDTELPPVGAIVRTPTGRLARVVRHAGIKPRAGNQRDHFERIVCEYLDPMNRAFAVVRLLPRLVEVVRDDTTLRSDDNFPKG